MSKWAEIRCDYCDDDGFWSVDAWRTVNNDEMGKVIAYIDSMTGRVIYIDPLARVDEYAQEVIKEALANKDIVTGIWALTTASSALGVPTTTELYAEEGKAEEAMIRALGDFADDLAVNKAFAEDSEPLHVPKMESAEAFKAYVNNNFPEACVFNIENPHKVTVSYGDAFYCWEISRVNVKR